MATKEMHVAMFTWLGMGHLTPYLYLANQIAERGHKISFLLPTKVQSKLQHLNLHPHLITFIPLAVPHVEGLPLGCETMSDVPVEMGYLLATAMDLMQPQVEATLHKLKPNFVFYEFAHWIPKVIPSDAKPIYFSISGPSIYLGRYRDEKSPQWIQADQKSYERDFGKGITLADRKKTCLIESHAMGFRAFREMEGPYYDSVESVFRKPILFPGPLLPPPPNSTLEERWAKWLDGFKEHSVVYCALGSETVISKNQFQELVLGLELTGLPFFAALKVPVGTASMDEALPEGFEERVKGRGVVHGGWVQQHLILNHPSVGCFVTHSGFSSILESFITDTQMVCIPQAFDQITNAKIVTRDLKAAVLVERRDEDGWFTKESVCNAVKSLMNETSEVGREIKANHAKWKDILLKERVESSYMNEFIAKLQKLLE